jgi:hypothetical protein
MRNSASKPKQIIAEANTQAIKAHAEAQAVKAISDSLVAGNIEDAHEKLKLMLFSNLKCQAVLLDPLQSCTNREMKSDVAIHIPYQICNKKSIFETFLHVSLLSPNECVLPMR